MTAKECGVIPAVAGSRLKGQNRGQGLLLITIALGQGGAIPASLWNVSFDDSKLSDSFRRQAASVATPTFSPAAGAYKSQSYPKDITISTTTAGAHIYYTTDLSIPSEGHGTLISTNSGTVPNLASGTTLKAIGLKALLTDSALKSGAYTSLPPCAQPVFNPTQVIDGPRPPVLYQVHISTTTAGASLSYTKDGSPPTPGHGTIVSAMSTDANIVAHSSIFLQAIAFKSSGNSDSAIMSG